MGVRIGERDRYVGGMCGRFTSSSTPDELGAFFEVDEIRTEPLQASFNVAPTATVYAVALSHTSDTGRLPTSDAGRPPTSRPPTAHRVLGAFKWGLVPYWSKEPSTGARMINARSDSVATKPAYRAAFERRRCIIPADAFYEWQRRENSQGKPAGKLPHAIARSDGHTMAFGGIWERWRPKDQPEAEPLRTCAIVTTAANEVVSPIHDRMPLVLAEQDWSTWLDPATQLVEVEKLMVPAPSEWFDVWPISSKVNQVANDSPDLLDRLPSPPTGADDDAPSLFD
jgi:putative SOS response-associated peptidase YedK